MVLWLSITPYSRVKSTKSKPRDFLDFPSGGEKKAFRNFDDKLEQWRCPRGLKTAKESQISQANFLPGLVCVFDSPKKRLRANLYFQKFCSYLFGIKCHTWKRVLASLKRFVKANGGSKSADILNVKVRIGRKEYLININLLCLNSFQSPFYTYSKINFSLLFQALNC